MTLLATITMLLAAHTPSSTGSPEGSIPLAKAIEQPAVAFIGAGFEMMYEQEGFVAHSAPVETELGTIVTGRVASTDDRPSNKITQGAVWFTQGAVWRLEDNEVDVFTPPEDPEGRKGWKWRLFGPANRHGDVIGRTSWSDWVDVGHPLKQKVHLDRSHLLDELGVLEQIDPTDEGWPNYTYTRPNAINDRRQVCGDHGTHESDHSAFVWSKNGGLEVFEKPGGVTQLTATDINNDGMVIGRALRSTSEIFAYWSPPTRAGEKREIKEIELPDTLARIMMPVKVNDQGVVLITAALDTPGEVSLENFRTRPYIWSVEGGFKPLPHPERKRVESIDFNERGDVLLEGYDYVRQGDNRPVLTDRRYYITHDGETTQLPEYPGASHTRYIGISDSGMISGVASITTPAEPATVVSFVIRIDGNE